MAYHIDELQPGMSASTSKTVTEADIILFAGISTDVNPAHLDEEYCKGTMFGTRIAHGMLSAGFHFGDAGQQAARPRHHLPVANPEVQGPGQTGRHRPPLPSPCAKSMSPRTA